MDAVAGKTGVLLSHNAFAYCTNNPVNMKDDSGRIPSPLGIALGVIGGIVGWGFGG